MKIALDATYSLGEHLSGVGTYSREILHGLPAAHPEGRFQFCYRPHRFLRALREPLPPSCQRRLIFGPLTPRSPDLFHGLNQRLPEGRFQRSVSTFHDLFVLTGEYSSPEFRTRFAAQARDAAQRSDLIISVSAFTASQVEELLGVESSRIRLIPHGVRPPAAVLETQQTQAREKMILHVGAIQKRKNVARLIRAFEQVGADWRLVLAGSLGFGSAEILQQIENSPCRNRIQLTGYVSQAILEDLYSRALILAFPSLDEGFGIPVLEAMAWGVPVLTSNRSALLEVAGDAALLVNPEDTEELTFALRRLTEEETLRQDLKKKGFERASHFRWENAIQKTWVVYSELMNRA